MFLPSPTRLTSCPHRPNGVAKRRREAAGLLPHPSQEPCRRRLVRLSHLLARTPADGNCTANSQAVNSLYMSNHAVDLATVADVVHRDQALTPINRVDHSVLPNSKTVKPLSPHKLHAAPWEWVCSQTIDRVKYSRDHFRRNRA